MSSLKNKGFCKIVATLGPNTSTEEMIDRLVMSGVSVFRFNCSHGSLEEYQQRIKGIRAAEKKYNCNIGILFDLQGPKLRIGRFKDSAVITLKEGDKFRVDLSPEPGDKTRVSLPHPEIFQAMQEGLELLINDGIVRVRVDSFTADSAETTVIAGGQISDRKGVNVPGAHLPISALTEKDLKDLKMAEDLGADFVALSFVQKAEDIIYLRSLMRSQAGVIAKIEKPKAVEDLDKILEVTDVIMVARGDLGVEMNSERVPVIQRRMINACRKAGKPVIVATQMLESMVNNVTPTRAEASDVATAVYEGADAVMLSAETANGKHPIEAVSTMRRIITTVEREIKIQEPPVSFKVADNPEQAIIAAAGMSAKTMAMASLIINFTDSGTTTKRTAKERPYVPILSLTPYEDIARRMTLVWGVTSMKVKNLESFDDILREARAAALASGMAKEGDKAVITAGVPFGHSGDTNLLYIVSI
ncbi:Pyruvate kinase [Elusimicrobium minutum Pei191]|uniref:Pyruvate kinase n=1 Tax=Elusimicrobium minutum (strain Pei191) TaxID=445932 RepID=B2KCJ2_ELUMP|nr:pyruvate kinase [Elusimicrobium minutum]ACC98113.1 Pyruvate kinase [Elusimicrobium minutum Pei191]